MIIIIFYIVIGIVTFLLYVKWRQTYWKRLGVPTTKQAFFFGDAKKLVLKQSSMGELNLKWYRDIKQLGTKHGGVYFFWDPFYIPVEVSIIKQILQKDFMYFTDHGRYHHEKDVLSLHLFNLEGEKWKTLRAKLTPTFTSGKMKMMFGTLPEKTVSLEKKVEEYATNHDPFTIKDVLGRFTTDIIASCAFGIECDSLSDLDNIFRKYGKKIFEPKITRFLFQGMIPWKLLGYLGYKSAGWDITHFFTSIVKETIKSREENEIYRKDFMHLLLQLKNQGHTSDSAKITSDGGTKGQHLLSEDDIIAQCFVFFLAGFETSSTTMTFALLELARNPQIQDRLRKEINTVLGKHNGEITYDAVMEMEYLDKVINETLRRFPPATGLPRVCTKNYKVPGTDVVIEKGTKVQIPVWGIHMDPEFYPNPEVFDPERFSEENKASRPDFTFLPFGEGPRMCIGLRFGMLQSKIGLVSLIRNFEFILNKKTPLPIEIEKGSIIITVNGEVWLDAVRISV